MAVHICEQKSMADLPVQLAVIEVVEYFMFCCIGKEPIPRTNADNPKLYIKMRTLGETSGKQVCFQIKVMCRCKGMPLIGFPVFLKDRATCLLRITEDMELLYEGGHLWTEFPDPNIAGQAILSEWHVKDIDAVTSKSKAGAVDYKHVVFRVIQEKSHVMAEFEGFKNYLHRLKLTHSDIDISLLLNINGAKAPFSFGLDAWSKEGTLHLKMSPPFKVPTEVLGRQSGGGNLRLTIGAALSPRPLPDDLIINTDCTHMQMLTYGPGRLPALVPGVNSALLRPHLWLHLQDYGLAMGHETGHIGGVGAAEADYCCILMPSDNEGPVAESEPGVKYILQLFLFIDHDKDAGSSSAKLELLDQIRQNLAAVISKHRTKFRKAASAAISKLLCNDKAILQKQRLMEKVIPSFSSSLTDIISGSISSSFRCSTFSSMQVHDITAFNEAVTKTMWSLAHSKHGIDVPNKDNHSEFVDHTNQNTTKCRKRESTEILSTSQDEKKSRENSATGVSCSPPSEEHLTSHSVNAAGTPMSTLDTESKEFDTDWESFNLLQLGIDAGDMLSNQNLDIVDVDNVLTSIDSLSSSEDRNSCLVTDRFDPSAADILFNSKTCETCEEDCDWLTEVLSSM